MMRFNIWIGSDPREKDAVRVARCSIMSRLSTAIPIHDLVLSDVRAAGLYHRPTEVRDGRLWDTISEAPMSTEFAISRFLTPILDGRLGWSLFVDGDIMARADLIQLFDQRDERFAVMCVKHNHVPKETIKMDNQVQTLYQRKNWSSVMLFNSAHHANKLLSVDRINRLPGRDLHRFCWLEDEMIGSLTTDWNWLAGYSSPLIDPKIVHFTDGTPDMPGFRNSPYADEWRKELSDSYLR